MSVFGPLLHFFGPFWVIISGPMGLFMGSRSGSKTFLERKLSILVMEVQPYLFVFDFAFFVPSGLFFWALLGIIGVEVRLKNIFGTYSCRLSIFALEVQSYLFVFHSAKFRAFLHFLGSSGLFLGLGSGQ